MTDQDNGAATRDTTEFTPPYIAFKTFIAQIDRMKEIGIPLRIDRSFFQHMSGSQQTQIMQALRAFGFLGPGGRVEPEMEQFIGGDEDQRKAAIRGVLEAQYAPLVRLAEQKGTQGQMEEWFKTFDYSRLTMAKAVAFFLQAADYAGVPKSPYFRPVRGVGTPSKARTRRTDTREEETPETLPERPSEPRAAAAGDRYTITLASGGEIELRVNVSLFGLSDRDMKYVLDLVNKVRQYTPEEVGPADRVQTDDQPAS